MNLNDIREILDLVREHELAEFELERDGIKIRVKKEPAAGPVRQAGAVTPRAVEAGAHAGVGAGPGPAGEGGAGAAPAAVLSAESGHHVVRSPIVGTLYRSPEPGAPPFVEVGQRVTEGQVLCIIEAMKLMNEIDADCTGELVAIYVENGQPVQYGDRLFAIKTA